VTTTKVEPASTTKAGGFIRSGARRRKAALFAIATAAAFVLLGLANRASAQESQRPPPNNTEYFQYGVGLAVEQLASGGDVCPANATTPCILGSGGGLAIRMGYRSRGPWYAGGAYEFTRMDSSNLLRLAILQQLRAEARYYLDLEFQVTQSTVIGAAVCYRGFLLHSWADSTHQERADRYLGFGLAHTIGLELTLELRDPLARW